MPKDRVRGCLALMAAAAVAVTGCDPGTGATPTTTAPAPVEAPSPQDDGPADEAAPLESVRADDCHYGGRILSIEATTEHEVVFTLCGPDPAFLAKVAFVPLAIHSAEHLRATGGSPLADPVGTGPFALDRWTRGSEIVLAANEDYWGEEPPYSTLVVRWESDSAARVEELAAGNADYVTNLSGDERDAVEDNPDLVVLPDHNPNVLYVGMDNRFDPFHDVRVRQAVAMGIDRERLVEAHHPPGSQVATHFTPCLIPNGCNGEPWYDFDAEAARELLADAGYPEGFATTIYVRDVPRTYLPEPEAMAESLASQLSDNLGISATVEVQDSDQFLAASTTGEHDGLHLLGWGADYPHITNFLDFHFGGGNEQFGEPLPEVTSLLAEGATVVDAERAVPIYERVNDLLREEVPMVPIAWAAAADAAVASLQGAVVPPFGAAQHALMAPAGDRLVRIQAAEPLSLYCADETDGESLAVCEQVMEGLYGYTIAGEVEPRLAESCEPDDEGVVWTCALRQGVTFHDGSAFDSIDVVVSWGAALDAAHPLHVGNSGLFEYYDYLWGGLING